MREHSGARIGVLGLTSWGLGLALTLARAGRDVLLIAREPAEAAEAAASRRHRRLPGAALPANVAICATAEADLSTLRVLLLAVPAQRLRANLRAIAPLLSPHTLLVSAAKGLEEGTRLRMTQVIGDELGPDRPSAALSGPNLVPEIVAGLPAAAVLASRDAAIAAELQPLLATPRLRLYTSRDVIGVEIGGALKNVIALAAGLSEGLSYGDNAKAALITRGRAEIVRLGAALGAAPITFAGLSGLGDLVATCGSLLSRNRRAGRLLGEGMPVAETLVRIGEVVEGIGTTAAAHALACEKGVDTPITHHLDQVLYEGVPPRDAAAALMLRSLTGERPI